VLKSLVRISGLTAAVAIALVALFYGVVLNGFGLFESGQTHHAGTSASESGAPAETAKVPLHPDKALTLPSSPEPAAPVAQPEQTAALPPASADPEPAPDPEPSPQRTARDVTPPNVLNRPTSRFGDRPKVETPKEEEPDPTTLYHRVVVHEPGRYASGKTTIRLTGIAAISADKTCKDETGDAWPCGRVATAALRRLIRNRALDCVTVPESGGEIVTTCRVGTQDVAEWLVQRGWAETSGDTYAEAAEIARAQKLGIYRGDWDAETSQSTGAVSLTAFSAPTVESDPFGSLPPSSGVSDGPLPDGAGFSPQSPSTGGLGSQGAVQGTADQVPGLVDPVQGNE